MPYRFIPETHRKPNIDPADITDLIEKLHQFGGGIVEDAPEDPGPRETLRVSVQKGHFSKYGQRVGVRKKATGPIRFFVKGWKSPKKK